MQESEFLADVKCAWSLEWFAAAADRVEVLSVVAVAVAVIGGVIGVGVAALRVAGGHERLLGGGVGAEAKVGPGEQSL